MRKYVPKDDVQKKSYYTDRYWVAPQVAKSPVESDDVFAADLAAISAQCDVLDSYIQVDQMVVVINPDDNFKVAQILKDECEYNQLSECSAIDWLAKKGQFEVLRILMPDDWVGHPLLKTYPLQGDEAASWYEVDRIYGKEARDIIGPENRDSAVVDRYDTERFGRLGHEVARGEEFKEDQPKTPLGYQEEGGVLILSKFHEDDAVTITDRKR
jgi:NADH-quinone oxidoreductase subunit C